MAASKPARIRATPDGDPQWLIFVRALIFHHPDRERVMRLARLPCSLELDECQCACPGFTWLPAFKNVVQGKTSEEQPLLKRAMEPSSDGKVHYAGNRVPGHKLECFVDLVPGKTFKDVVDVLLGPWCHEGLRPELHRCENILSHDQLSAKNKETAAAAATTTTTKGSPKSGTSSAAVASIQAACSRSSEDSALESSNSSEAVAAPTPEKFGREAANLFLEAKRKRCAEAEAEIKRSRTEIELACAADVAKMREEMMAQLTRAFDQGCRDDGLF